MKTIPVMGRDYVVEYVNLDPDLYGECVGNKAVIRINRDASEQQKRDTVLHELCHAILFETGLHCILDEQLEEAVVRALEHGLSRSGIIKEFELNDETM